ncbi:Hypothetical predicted protein [Paramuricea clavata]|uniref:Uncharacterized protein n=1 Tax=Paramuricea clavata TaxID=317549 RepID=A0A6S7IHP4_PARCT|nr:Hypothetical predicted protein [Paramuricea clavata]
MPQSNIQTIPVNNMLSNSNVRESFSADQLAQITQIVLQSISSFFESQHTTTTTTCVDEQPTIPPTPPGQLGQFSFLSSSELQQQPTSSHGPVASIQQADGGFTPDIPNKYVRDIESGISTPCKPQVLTNIEEWTTAFNTYMLIIVQKFPNRALELLQYMETIRHAAKTHGGLGWVHI